MATTIAVAGKGGTGKTTLSGMLIKYLCEKGKDPILAVDADANSNLNEVLGIEAPRTLGDVREEVARADMADPSPIPSSMTKREYMEIKLNSALVEEDDYDMIIMGRTEGKGCYCFVNDLLQRELEKRTSAYNYIIVDNEAGMEHISRGTLPNIDMLILVSDCSRRGIQAAGRIASLSQDLKLNPKTTRLIVNRAPSTELVPSILEEIREQKLDLVGVVPQDEMIYEYDAEGKPTSEMPNSSIAKSAAEKIFAELLGF